MNGTTHKIAGICSAIAVASTCGMEWKTAAILTVSSYFGSLIPDIDEPNSTIGRRFKLVSNLCNRMFKHRGLIHTPFFLLILNLLIRYGNPSPEGLIILTGFNIGFISHLLLDLLTPQGISILYPISRSKIHIFGWSSKNRDLICSILIVVATVLYTAG